MQITTTELHTLTDKALIAFWEVIVDAFPQAETGDLSIDLTFRLAIVAERAVQEWVYLNVPPLGE